MARKKGGGISDSTLGIASIVVAASAGALLLVSNRASASSGGGGGGGGGSGPVQVTVRVSDSTTSQPVVAALVQLGTLGQPSDGSGDALFNISAGSYNLAVTAGGYTPFNETVSVSSSESIPVALTPAAAPPPPPCNQLVPEILTVPASETVYLAWMVDVDWSNGLTEIIKVGTIDSNPSSCPGSGCYVGDWSTQTWPLDLKGSLTDSAGAPVCEAVIEASVAQASVPWVTQDGTTGNALFGVGLPYGEYGPPQPVVTDANGNFTVPVFVTLQVTQGAAPDNSGQGGGPVQAQQTVTFSVSGYPLVSRETPLNFRLLVCWANLTYLGC